jgi:hypothetical protein
MVTLTRHKSDSQNALKREDAGAGNGPGAHARRVDADQTIAIATFPWGWPLASDCNASPSCSRP